jgi:hypothetical protein
MLVREVLVVHNLMLTILAPAAAAALVVTLVLVE